MSITSLTHYKKPSNRRRNSGELDVFEAAQYFSEYNDNFTLVGGANMTPNIVLKEEKEANYLRVGRRISLDMPSQRHHHYYHHNHQENHPISHSHHHDRQQIKEKKYKQQPNSPGGKLANFLNSLFNQTSSRKKKSSKSTTTTTTTTHSLKDEDESYEGRRKRRSSISHFWSSNNSIADAKSIYSSSSSGFRTPPPNNLTTPTKPCKEFRSFAQHKDFLATLSKLSNNDGNGNSKKDDKTRSSGSKLNWVDEKIKSKSGFLEKPMNKYKLFNNGYQDKNREINEYSEEIMEDGDESDSSSDLFELKIDHGYRFCSTGLSVYETTHIDTINISSATPITIKN